MLIQGAQSSMPTLAKSDSLKVSFRECSRAATGEAERPLWADHVGGHMNLPFGEVTFAGLPAA
jgi:hypothetical protein